MKKLLVLLLSVFLFTTQFYGQVAINSDGNDPDPSAGLDVKFSNKGLLPPRMLKAELIAISNPADGLLVYSTDCGLDGFGAILMYMGGTWHALLSINCPDAPIAGTHITLPNQIIWNWNKVPGATGYKWNSTDDYASATDMGTDTAMSETGLLPNTTITRYVWAYNICGMSESAALSQILPLLVGQIYEGGLVFYLDGTGQHGLVCTTSDQSTGTTWGCYGTYIPGTLTAIGTGQANTTVIVNACSEAGRAARICNDLVMNGYSDCFLPSKDEIYQMYLQKDTLGFVTDLIYWSSSESAFDRAWSQNIYNSAQYNTIKSFTAYVRAVRVF